MATWLKALIWLLILGTAVYVVFQVVPVWYANYQFKTDIEQIAATESYSTRTEGEIQQIILARAEYYGILLRPEHVHIWRTGRKLAIEVKYSVQIEVPLYHFEITFHPRSAGESLLAAQ
jgi:predicted small integral membrane protein